MSPRSVLVTGANRGIGLGLVKRFLENVEIQIVIATARNVETAKDLLAISDPRLHILQLDISSDESVDQFVKEVSKVVGASGLNLLVNNAAVAVKYDTLIPNRSDLYKQLDTNLISLILFTQRMLPLLKIASRTSTIDEFSISRSAIIFISSGGGSITLNNWGSGAFGSMAYKVSKAGLNMFVKTVAFDWKSDNILCVSFCPGWVLTDLATPVESLTEDEKKKRITVEESSSALVKSFTELNSSHNGLFFNRHLEPIEF